MGHALSYMFPAALCTVAALGVADHLTEQAKSCRFRRSCVGLPSRELLEIQLRNRAERQEPGRGHRPAQHRVTFGAR
jgi:hypothetical protein